MAPIDKTRSIMRLSDIATLPDDWIVGIPAISEIAINNAKAITTALCALGIKHLVYPYAVETNGNASSGIQLEFDCDVEVEMICHNSGAIETAEFAEEVIADPILDTAAAIGEICHSGMCYRQVEHHTCPFKEEVNGDNHTLCQCCDGCTTQCAQDI